MYAEEAMYKVARQEFREQMEHKKNTKRCKEAFKEAEAKLKHCKKEKKRIEAVVMAQHSAKAYTLSQLGGGKKTAAPKTTKSRGSKYWTGFVPSERSP